MNHESVDEYILWLEKFRKIYKKYIDSSKELSEIFAKTLKKFTKVLRRGNNQNLIEEGIENNQNLTEEGIGNNQKLTEEGIIKLLKELVKKFSVAYDANASINKSKKGPRNTDAFKQNIYKNEIAELKELLIKNLDNRQLFPNFESIVMFVAKRRQMIEFLKLSKENDAELIDDCIYFEIYGKRRGSDTFISPLNASHAKHLYNIENKKKRNENNKIQVY